MSIRKSGWLVIVASLMLVLPASAHAAEQRGASDTGRPAGTKFSEPTKPWEPNPSESQPTWTISETPRPGTIT
jgi:hypothetical protein